MNPLNQSSKRLDQDRYEIVLIPSELIDSAKHDKG
ncbi:hypothetical protein FB479_111103 [Brevibacillus sp. AG162]|nr:hypothetical protein FB479_111103 [Brevibacillus sp. AG162]